MANFSGPGDLRVALPSVGDFGSTSAKCPRFIICSRGGIGFRIAAKHIFLGPDFSLFIPGAYRVRLVGVGTPIATVKFCLVSF